MSGFTLQLDVSSLQLGLQQDLQAMHDAARPAAQAGAQVLYDEAVRIAPRSERAHYFTGSSYKKTGQKYLFQPGTLKASIYQAFSKKDSKEGGIQSYSVSFNPRKAPYAFWIEYGYMQRYAVTHDPKTGRLFTDTSRPLAAPKQIPARPFIRAAWVNKAPQAEQAMVDRYIDELAQRGVVR